MNIENIMEKNILNSIELNALEIEENNGCIIGTWNFTIWLNYVQRLKQ